VSGEEKFFFFSFCCFRKAIEAAKSGSVFFHEAMGFISFEGNFSVEIAAFKKAAAKGHEESIWLLDVIKDVEPVVSAIKEVLIETEEPLGWYLAGEFSFWNSAQRFDFHKKSAEGGCSWAQVRYGWYFRRGRFVQQSDAKFREWLKKAADQNNGWAMTQLGQFGPPSEAEGLQIAAFTLGWKAAADILSHRSNNFHTGVKWAAKGVSNCFYEYLTDQFNVGDRDPLCCYLLGRGLYFHQYGGEFWNNDLDSLTQAFGEECLDFFCDCIDLQQESIFTFLMFWNRIVGIKGPGQMIGQMVWKEREKNLVKSFTEK
jgi:TPR repeat protein